MDYNDNNDYPIYSKDINDSDLSMSRYDMRRDFNRRRDFDFDRRRDFDFDRRRDFDFDRRRDFDFDFDFDRRRGLPLWFFFWPFFFR